MRGSYTARTFENYGSRAAVRTWSIKPCCLYCATTERGCRSSSFATALPGEGHTGTKKTPTWVRKNHFVWFDNLPIELTFSHSCITGRRSALSLFTFPPPLGVRCVNTRRLVLEQTRGISGGSQTRLGYNIPRPMFSKRALPAGHFVGAATPQCTAARRRDRESPSKRCMADIQSSLQRLQESIRGLSDASALVGALDVSGGIFEEGRAGTAGTSVSPPRQQAVSSPSEYHHRRRDEEGAGSNGSAAAGPDRRSSLGSSGGLPTDDEEQSILLSSIPRELRDSAEVCLLSPSPYWLPRRALTEVAGGPIDSLLPALLGGCFVKRPRACGVTQEIQI